MAFDLKTILDTLNAGLTTVNRLTQDPGVRTLAGVGLTGAGLAQKEEPGFAVDARQFLRNRLAPQGIADQFTSNLGPLSAGFQPYLNQLRERGIADVSQRYAAAFPSSVGAQGSEFGGISRYITDEALPREQALLSSLGLSSLQTGGDAAGKLLDYAKPDPLGAALATLGLNLLPGQGGQTGTGTTGGGSQLGQSLLNAFGGNASVGDAISQAVGLANTSGNTAALSALLQSGILQGVPFPIGLQASTPAGQIIQQAINAGLVESPAAIATSGPGVGILSSSLSSVLGLAGAGAGGFFAGQQLGGRLGQATDSQALGALGGAASGAAAGAVIGSIVPGIGTAIGAVVGGIAGLFGGFGSTRSGQQAQKEAFRQEDLSSQADQVQEIGSFFNQRLAELGVDPSAFQQFIAQQISASDAGEAAFSFGGISGTLDQQPAVARVGGALLLQAIQRTNPSITSLQQVPGLKQAFIDYLTRSTFSASNESFGGGAPLNQFDPWAGFAGLAKGGYITRPTNAIIGERGAEMAHLEPGSYVVPFANSLN